MTTAMRFHFGVVYFVLAYIVGNGKTVIFETALFDGLVCMSLMAASVYQLVRGSDQAMTAIGARRWGQL